MPCQSNNADPYHHEEGTLHFPTSGLSGGPSGSWWEWYVYEITLKQSQNPNCQLSLLRFPLDTGPFLRVWGFFAAMPKQHKWVRISQQPAGTLASAHQSLDMQDPAQRRTTAKGGASQAWLPTSPTQPSHHPGLFHTV